jgi:spore maturation protein CgeB
MSLPSPLRILYVADLSPGSTCWQRLRAFESLGCTLTPVDTGVLAHRQRDREFRERLRRRLAGPRDWTGANHQMLAHAAAAPFDIAWIDRGLTVEAATLMALRRLQPGCRIIGYSLDDMNARHNQSPQFLAHLRWYDVFFTTKSFGVDELVGLGCRRAVFSANGFDPATHRPLRLSAEERRRYGGAVGFIGTWEAERGDALYGLACSGVSVRVWGNGWERQRRRHPLLRIEGRAVYDDEYGVAINAFDINLCFLRKLNRDQQTTRSVEIPACGAFMLAERTPEHLALFTEAREAEYFGSQAELREKVDHYLRHPQRRQQIAAAGRRRCERDRYSYAARLEAMLDAAGVDWQSPCNGSVTREASA